MAKSLEDILSEAAKDSKNINSLAKSVNELTAAKKAFMAAGDPKGVLAAQKMVKTIEALIKTTEDYEDQLKLLKKAQKEGRDLSEEEIKTLNRVIKEKEKATDNTLRLNKKAIASTEALGRSQAQYEADALRYFRTYTLGGKVFHGLTETISKYAANLTFAGLVQKAWNRHIQSSEIQQNILIQSYKGFRVEQEESTKATTKFGNTLEEAGGKAGKNAAGALTFAKATLTMSTAIAQTEATAQRMGVSTEHVGDAFTKFARITGSQTPAVLKTLSEGAITVSRAMGISVPEAIDFVSTRMDKFGGSASGAIASMYNMQKEAERTNKEFGRTVIRGDDVVRTIQDISKQTTIYGIDQRFVGNILRENVARLQSTGKSYDAAQRQAKAFTEAVTGKAPEWMQVYAAFDVSDKLLQNFKGDELNEGMKKELEAAKPGLSKEVENLMKGSGGKLTYSVKRAIGELTSGTTVGIGAMNKEILKLAKHPEGLTLISKQFGVSLADSIGMVESAKALEQKQTAISKITAKTVKYDEFSFNVGKKEIKLNDVQIKQMKEIDASSKSASDKETEKKELMESIYSQANDMATIDNDRLRLQAEEKTNLEQIGKINTYIANAQKQKAEYQVKLAKATTDKEKKELTNEIARIDKMIAGKELERSRYESKSEEEKGKAAGLKTVEDINKELLNEFSAYANVTGKSLQAMVTELTSTKGLLIAAGLVGMTRYLLNYTGALARIEKLLAMKSFGGGGDGSGGDGSGDGDGIGSGDGSGGGDSSDKKGKGKNKKGAKKGVKKGAKKGAKTPIKPKSKKGRVGAVIGLAVAGIAIASMFSGGEAKAAEKSDKDSDDAEGKKAETEDAKKAATDAVEKAKEEKEDKEKENKEKGSSISEKIDTGLAAGSMISSFGGVAAKAMNFAKGAKAIPLVGNVVAGGFALKTAWDIYEKWSKDPKSVSKADAIKMAMQLGGMIPGIGNLVAIADISADVTGVYAKLDTPIIDPLDKNMGKGAESTSALAGAKIPSNAGKELGQKSGAKLDQDIMKTTTATGPILADTSSGAAPTGSFMGGPSADGSITLKIENFMNAFAKSNTMMKQGVQRQSG